LSGSFMSKKKFYLCFHGISTWPHHQSKLRLESGWSAIDDHWNAVKMGGESCPTGRAICFSKINI
jgi:hypothetical protein